MSELAQPEIFRLLQGGHYAEAERACRSEMASAGSDQGLILLLAIAVHYQNRLDEALDLYAQLTRLAPESSANWGNYAKVLHEAGRLQEARSAFTTALECPPVGAETLLGYGLLLLRLELFVEARRVLLRARAEAPTSADICLAAAKASHAVGDYRVGDLIEHWRDWLPLDTDKSLELAGVLMSAGSAQSAVALVEDLDRRVPEDVHVGLQLAGMYERVNRPAEAETRLSGLSPLLQTADATLRLEAEHLRARLAARKRDYAAAGQILLAAGPRNRRDFDHYFELARVHDKLGMTAAAMNALSSAHLAQAEKIKTVTGDVFEADSPPLPQSRQRVTPADYASWPNLIAPEVTDSPVFVVGFPRSGTTLLEQMLDAHPALQSMDEQPFFNTLAHQLEDQGAKVPDQLGILSQRDCDELRKGYQIMACGKVPRRNGIRLVDKNPLNMLWLPLIHRMYPHASWILALRHPCDVVLSCYMQNFRANPLAMACASLASLATAYVAAMECWQHHVEIFKPTVHESRYEELVRDTSTQARRIADFVGLASSQELLRFDQRARAKGFIGTPSYTQVVEPVNANAVGRWQRYREYLEPVLPILRPQATRLGYSVDAVE